MNAVPGHVRWRIVAILCGLAFVLYIDRINISVAAPHMAEEFGFSSQGLGPILSAFLFGYAFGLAPGGWLADRFGPHKVLTIAGLLWAVITGLTGYVPRRQIIAGVEPAAMLVGVRFLLGICEACAYPTFHRALANWMRRSERARASGIIHGASALGGAFSPVFIVVLVKSMGWRQSFLVSGMLTFGMAFWWYAGGTSQPHEHRRVSEAELELIASAREESRIVPATRAWWGRLARSREAWLLCASLLFYGLAIFVFITWFYIYFVEVRRAGPIYSAALSSLPYVAMAVGAPAGGFICDRCVVRYGRRWGLRIVPLFALAGAGACAGTAPMIPSNAAAAGVFALAAGLQYVAASAYWAAVIDVTRTGAGTLGGLMNASGNLGQAVGTLAFPWLAAFAGWTMALQITGAAALLAGLIWLLIDPSRQIDQRLMAPPEAVAR